MTDRRDIIALEVLKIALPRSNGSPMAEVARDCYDMADAMEAARSDSTPQSHPDTARLDWMLAMLDSSELVLALTRCRALGMTGREAIDAAAKRHPL